jgi:hypothetical protein
MATDPQDTGSGERPSDMSIDEERDRNIALDALRAHIRAGIEQADRGELVPGAVVLEEIREISSQRRRAQAREPHVDGG